MSAEYIKRKIASLNKELSGVEELLSEWKTKKRIAENPDEVRRCKVRIEELEEDERNLLQQIEDFETQLDVKKTSTKEINKNTIYPDKTFKQLCNLDFRIQEQKFKSLMEERSFGVFIIRGKNECGQRWLVHQLIEPFQKEIDFPFIFEDLGLIFDNMSKKIDFEKDTSNTQKYDEMVTFFAKNHCDKHQFIIFRKVGGKSSPTQLKELYSDFLNRLHIEILKLEKKGVDNKTIVFFVEEDVRLSLMDADECICFEEDNLVDHPTYHEMWQKKKNYLYLIGLEPIKEITYEDFNTWLRIATLTSPKLPETFDCENAIVKFLCDCQNGNPHHIIHELAKLLEYEIQWKY